MSANDARALGGSLKLLMDEVCTAERTINDVLRQGKEDGLIASDVPALEFHRWRPAAIDPPSLYNLVAPSPFVQADQLRWRDTINLAVRIAVPYGEHSSEMEWLEPLSDCFRQAIDPMLGTQTNPFNGAAKWAERTDMRSMEDAFNEVPFACMEFIIQCRLDRMMQPT